MHVVPAQAGIHTEEQNSDYLKQPWYCRHTDFGRSAWVPTFAGTTVIHHFLGNAMFKRFALLAAAGLLSTAAFAQTPVAQSQVQVNDAWIRATVPAQKATG